MKLPLSWLSDYTDISGVTPKEYDARMTMSGSKVEEVCYLGEEIENVVVGRINEMVRHPNSDHMWICQIDVGDEVTQICTGAWNIHVGDLIRSPSTSPPCPAHQDHQGQAARRGVQWHAVLAQGTAAGRAQRPLRGHQARRDPERLRLPQDQKPSLPEI